MRRRARHIIFSLGYELKNNVAYRHRYAKQEGKMKIKQLIFIIIIFIIFEGCFNMNKHEANWDFYLTNVDNKLVP
jgi:hypothetical protein